MSVTSKSNSLMYYLFHTLHSPLELQFPPPRQWEKASHQTPCQCQSSEMFVNELQSNICNQLKTMYGK